MPHVGRRAATSVLVGALAGLIAAGPAQAGLSAQFVPLTVPAQSRPKMAVVVIPVSPAAQEEAARIEAVARTVVDKSGRFDRLRLVDVLDSENARARESRAKDGQNALDAARSAYNDLDTNKALSEADKAIKAFADSDLTLHIKDLSGAWIFKIASLVANGENKAAQLEMDKLLAIDPSANFSPNFFPPEEIAYAEKVRKQLADSDEEIDVKTTPPGAEIFVDGKYVGISPVSAKGLTNADHYITANAAGYALAQQKSRPGTADITLRKSEAWPRYEALLTKVAKDPEGPLRDAAAKEFGQWLGVDQVLLGVVDHPPAAKGPHFIALRLDPRDGHNYAFQQDTLAAGDAMTSRAETMVTALMARDEQRNGGPVTHFKDLNKGNTKKIAGYALLGTGAAVFVGGLAFGIAANGKHNEFRSLPQTDLRATDARNTGKTYAVVADVSFLIGIAAAGVGSYLAFLSGPKPEGSTAVEPGPTASTRTPPASSTSSSSSTKKEPPPPAKKPEEKKPVVEQKPVEDNTVEDSGAVEEKKPEEKKPEAKKPEEKKKTPEAKKPPPPPEKKPEEKKPEQKKKSDEDEDLRNY